VAEPKSLTLSVQLRSDACVQSNQWEFWVFPERKPGLAARAIANLTREPLLDTLYAREAVRNLDRATLALATNLTSELLTWVAAGGAVILLEQNERASSVTRPEVVGQYFKPPSGLLREYGGLGYWPLWLRCDAQVAERHPALEGFPHQGFSGFQFMRLFGAGVPAVELTPRTALARPHVTPVVWGLHLIPWGEQDAKEETSKFGYTMAWHSALSEGGIGRGHALICNLWVIDGIRRGFPEARYLLDCLVSYAGGGNFSPKLPALTVEEAKGLFLVASGQAKAAQQQNRVHQE
jgi:hypothetical protein